MSRGKPPAKFVLLRAPVLRSDPARSQSPGFRPPRRWSHRPNRGGFSSADNSRYSGCALSSPATLRTEPHRAMTAVVSSQGEKRPGQGRLLPGAAPAPKGCREPYGHTGRTTARMRRDRQSVRHAPVRLRPKPQRVDKPSRCAAPEFESEFVFPQSVNQTGRAYPLNPQPMAPRKISPASRRTRARKC